MKLLGAFLCGAIALGCCGRGEEPVGPRPTIPLEERGTPWAGDVVLSFDRGAPLPAGLEAALAAVPGVQRARVDPGFSLARVWLADPASAPIAALCQAAREAGRPAVPTAVTRLHFGDAGEKGRADRATLALMKAPGVAYVEVEVDREDALARAWCRPGTSPAALRDALAHAGIVATAVVQR